MLFQNLFKKRGNRNRKRGPEPTHKYEWFGPWNLEPYQDGNVFDVKQFIENAEADKYGLSRFKGAKIDRELRFPAVLETDAPWYQQLKMDVENGVYDESRWSEYEAAYQEWKYYQEYHGDFIGDWSEEEMRWRFACRNKWVIVPILMTCAFPMGHAIYCSQDMFNSFAHHPESGWRKV